MASRDTRRSCKTSGAPHWGAIPPGQCIALAEQTGLVRPFTQWALKIMPVQEIKIDQSFIQCWRKGEEHGDIHNNRFGFT